MRVIDAKTPGQVVAPSVFLHGLTGVGKSTWACSGGRPLVILTEPKAMSVLRQVNPDAVGMAPESTEDVVELFSKLGSPAWTDSLGVDRIVLDSFTDLCYSLPRWMKDGSGILLKMEIQEFGDLKNYALALVNAIQLTGLPSIIIARSTVKKTGRVEKICPDGYGKSVEELPGKCLPTVEARYDSELGYLIDSTPDEYSQRCGLPWVPAVWTGPVLDFLSVVARREAPTRAPEISQAETQRLLGEMVQARAARLEEVPSAASDFVDALVPLGFAGPNDCAEITDLAQRHKVSLARLAAYLHEKGKMPNPKDWTRITSDGYSMILPYLTDPHKRRGLVLHLDKEFSEVK